MDLKSERIAMLHSTIEQRERSVMGHDVNIENYTHALANIEANHKHSADMQAFANQLRDLKDSSVVERRKEEILLAAARAQLEGISA